MTRALPSGAKAVVEFQNTPNRCLRIEGEEVWISRSVTVLAVVILVKDGIGYVPLGLRGHELPDESGKWGLPGGYLDYDESAGGAVIREIWEELGLDIPALQAQYRFCGSLDQPYEVNSQPLRRQNVTLRFPLMFWLAPEASLPALNPQVGVGEVVEAQWFAVEAALKMALAFNHQKALQQCLEGYFQDVWPPR